MHNTVYPFSAIVGQERLKLALILNAVNPRIGGVLIRGKKGTAKSTTVRALAAVLPEIRSVTGCPYCCDPDDPHKMCPWCRENFKTGQIIEQPIRVVTLPINATEDRITGAIDFNLAVKKGIRSLQPGLLAKAHRGILYVDEVNLLDDHIVDLILDAAASGENVVEREGISFSHPSRFILMGTMNPEEGELRPQLLDRFGLCVEVSAEEDLKGRMLLMQRREAFDSNPHDFISQFKKQNGKISEHIVRAQSLLPDVDIPQHLQTFICELCVQNNVAGHRADMVIEQASLAHAAMKERREVTLEDIRNVSAMALSHRIRNAAPPPPPPQHEHEHYHDQQEQPEEEDRQEERPEQQDGPQSAEAKEDRSDPSGGDQATDAGEGRQGDSRPHDSREQVFDVGQPFKVRKFASPKDRILRRGSGRRSRTRTGQKQGRYIKSTSHNRANDIAFDATLRAAAPYQIRRKSDNGLCVNLRAEDIREKVREKRIGNFLLFLVDASGSMGARGRMVASKGAIMSLLLDAYQKRDRVAMVSFRGSDAVINLPLTSSIELAGKLLKEMPVGGRTPLSAGLVKAHELLRNALLRDPFSRPIVLMLTDGKANVAVGAKKPIEEALEFAARMASDERIQFIVVDTEGNGLIRFGFPIQLAAAMNARYFQIEDLKAEQLIQIVRNGDA